MVSDKNPMTALRMVNSNRSSELLGVVIMQETDALRRTGETKLISLTNHYTLWSGQSEGCWMFTFRIIAISYD